jgi:hypothetical protein
LSLIDPEVSKAIMKYGLAGGGHFVGSDELQSYWAEATRVVKSVRPRLAILKNPRKIRVF